MIITFAPLIIYSKRYNIHISMYLLITVDQNMFVILKHLIRYGRVELSQRMND